MWGRGNMGYTNMTFKEGGSRRGFQWYMAVELILIFMAIAVESKAQFFEVIGIFILIEVIEINGKLKKT